MNGMPVRVPYRRLPISHNSHHRVSLSITHSTMRDVYKLFLRNLRLFRRLPLHVRWPLLLLTFVCTLGSVFLLVHFVFDLRSPPFPKSANDFLSDVESLRATAKLQSEASLAARLLCRRRIIHGNIQFLSLCGRFPRSSSAKKIVALVEVRNVERMVTPFLSALAPVVDSVVVLDDRSTDLTRNAVMLFNTRSQNAFPKRQHPLVEVLLNKTDTWRREELNDRNVLLKVGRLVGGTHFVLLDYDEYFSTNCVHNGLLRNHILGLQPREALNLPWIELWKSPYTHAVLPSDSEMNFLTRRQVVIFADDRRSVYTAKNSGAKILRSSKGHHQDSSIHVLRCPHSICEQPPRYHGQTTLMHWGNVQALPQCKIIEMRFLNVHNALLKAAWYEALGFVSGAPGGTTIGKMVDVVLREFNRLVAVDGQLSGDTSMSRKAFEIVKTKRKWIDGLGNDVFQAYGRVEMWRAVDILAWVYDHGEDFFKTGKVVPMLDLAALKEAVGQVTESGDMALHHVPRIKKNTLIIAFDSPSMPVLSEFLAEVGIPSVKAAVLRHGFVKPSDDGRSAVQDEEWRHGVEDVIAQAFQKAQQDSLFVSCDVSETAFGLALLRMARDNLSGFYVMAIFGDRVDGTKVSTLYEYALHFSTEAGSHMRVMDIPLASFASVTSLHWLRQRVGVKEGDGSAVVTFAEGVHRRYGGKGLALAPVAKLVFSLNVGRSGSKYLADVLTTVAAPINSVHEGGCPGKECTKGGAMRMQSVSLHLSYAKRRRVKLPLVRKGVADVVSGREISEKWLSTTQSCECSEVERGATAEVGDLTGSWEAREIFEGGAEGCMTHVVRDGVYAETNPNFKAWFYDVVLDEMPLSGYEVVVLVVRKYVAAVLRSLAETGFFSKRDGYTWMETASGVNSRVRVMALGDDSKLDAVEKVLSYVVNAEAVFAEIVERYGANATAAVTKVRFVDVVAERVYGEDGVKGMLQELGLEGSARTWEVAAEVRDKYREGGKMRVHALSLSECEERVRAFVRKCGGEKSEVAKLLQRWTRVESFDYEVGHLQK